MIRGTHKQIVVLQEFENTLFEQAIFILKPDAIRDYKKNPEDVVREARKVVDTYAQRNGITKTKVLSAPRRTQPKKAYVFLSLSIISFLLLAIIFFLLFI